MDPGGGAQCSDDGLIREIVNYTCINNKVWLSNVHASQANWMKRLYL